jgi:hypothetical protein
MPIGGTLGNSFLEEFDVIFFILGQLPVQIAQLEVGGHARQFRVEAPGIDFSLQPNL